MGETGGAHALRPLGTQNEEHQEHEVEQHGSAERKVRTEAVRRVRAEDDKNARKGVNEVHALMSLQAERQPGERRGARQ